jgi:hypothetical protein
MKHHRRAIRFWLTSAFTTVGSLGLASGAAAMRDGTDWSTAGVTQQSPPVVADPSGFNWGLAAIATVVAVAAVLVAISLVQVARNRTRLLPSH